jgi:hypothetical protein
MQALDLVHTSSHIIKDIIEALLFNNLLGGVKDKQRVWSHIVVNLHDYQ